MKKTHFTSNSLFSSRCRNIHLMVFLCPWNKNDGEAYVLFFPGSLFSRPVIHAKQFSRERPHCGPSHADRANSNKKKPLYLFLTISCELWTSYAFAFFCIDRIQLHRIYHEVIFPSQHPPYINMYIFLVLLRQWRNIAKGTTEPGVDCFDL